ncbi:UDP-N-acetylmuramoyl-tripeptide--D-alanyl-D-alanine ligase [Acinetobacter qingfengensis]|uniref:UDP-N-acetylmuramoyl-tripeptide--D-alanyl-D-alanine ligase n=1 Tax=Acinetobacter qingfengensis TaxID=1262585 RepID=A0A1E7QZ57_9GAMM|nr:UDP-N-acetylmuramoyl-tripeptide--D-alanyl-D-alanine ligase [Acinetobacter qingfengensis]KAA8733146.1 UDP-N-acetylmuramoyl-tripeptide--D-alanyl-D-alanine ligase [Acinetobacter qingfengensis]OEY92296.1 UDP-N-acetylmuramoyl-tripeptide--D-alanyl-D-alanine ligase [Acinetobacter qingfengensis]
MHTSTTSTGRLDPWSSTQLQQATQGYWLMPDNAALTGGKSSVAHEALQIQRILTDSRQAKVGDAFLALKGERFDAHDFVRQVAEQGASCVIVQRAIDGLDLPQLIVADTRLALGHLGTYRRQQCSSLQVIALTGSSGKTTTKEMLGSIFSRLGETLVTRGNLNNDLGVPMMLLELRQDHRYAVMELGASHQGEIDYTSGLVQPDVAGIINIGTAHLGEFGGRQGICNAKSEIYAHIKLGGTAIIPVEDDFVTQIRQAAQHVSQLGFGELGDVYAKNVELYAQSSEFDLVTPQGVIHIHLPFAGEHNVHNAEAAASFALALHVTLTDIAEGLAQAKGAQGRLNFLNKHQYLLIDDTYNANPNSMRAAADVLCQQVGIKVMVMGDIGELGDAVGAEHYALGHDLLQKPLDYLIAVGEYAPAVAHGANSNKCTAYANQQDALDALLALVNKHQPQPITFLFKGSRYTHTENLLAALMEKL